MNDPASFTPKRADSAKSLLAQRTGSWAVDITGVGNVSDITNAAVPEPGSILLLTTGLAGLALVRRRNKH